MLFEPKYKLTGVDFETLSLSHKLLSVINN